MWLRFLPFLFLLLLSQASAMQQEPIDVPFEKRRNRRQPH
jgi:hypothetical protein